MQICKIGIIFCAQARAVLKQLDTAMTAFAGKPAPDEALQVCMSMVVMPSNAWFARHD